MSTSTTVLSTHKQFLCCSFVSLFYEKIHLKTSCVSLMPVLYHKHSNPRDPNDFPRATGKRVTWHSQESSVTSFGRSFSGQRRSMLTGKYVIAVWGVFLALLQVIHSGVCYSWPTCQQQHGTVSELANSW